MSTTGQIATTQFNEMHCRCRLRRWKRKMSKSLLYLKRGFSILAKGSESFKFVKNEQKSHKHIFLSIKLKTHVLFVVLQHNSVAYLIKTDGTQTHVVNL